IVVRRAEAGEKFTTLDDVERTLSPEDLLITDRGAGPSGKGGKIIGLAGVDPNLGPVAARRCADLLVELGGGTLSPATTQIGQAPEPTVIELPVERVSSLVGIDYSIAEVTGLLESIGAGVEIVAQGRLAVTVPSWRTDITDDVDLIE